MLSQPARTDNKTAHASAPAEHSIRFCSNIQEMTCSYVDRVRDLHFHFPRLGQLKTHGPKQIQNKLLYKNFSKHASHAYDIRAMHVHRSMKQNGQNLEKHAACMQKFSVSRNPSVFCTKSELSIKHKL